MHIFYQPKETLKYEQCKFQHLQQSGYYSLENVCSLSSIHMPCQSVKKDVKSFSIIISLSQ